ncbi:hypothetical protein [Dankookia sp. P2]|uniref:hypothetical protein n=1 Tax=Dankookia sp. P2 TaxID=3423955 RepID=UPI003D67E86D
MPLLLVLSIGGKVAVGNQSLWGAEKAVQGTTATMDRVTAFFRRHGFAVSEVGDDPDVPLFQATAGDCRVLALLAAPQGWHRDVIRRLASAGDQVFFVFDAATYQDQPKWPPWTHHYWQVLNYYVGRRVPTKPLLGVVTSSACDLRGMPWQEIAELP